MEGGSGVKLVVEVLTRTSLEPKAGWYPQGFAELGNFGSRLGRSHPLSYTRCHTSLGCSGHKQGNHADQRQDILCFFRPPEHHPIGLLA